MVIGILTALFTVVCFLLILLIFIQRGKGAMGLGSMGGSTQMLFGGSGGQDLFQKATWVLAAIFMFGSLGIAILTTRSYHESRYLQANRAAQLPKAPPIKAPETPSSQDSTAAPGEVPATPEPEKSPVAPEE